jgi:hypothetical protein
LPKTPPEAAVEKDAKKQVQCSRCGAIFVGKYKQWGTKKLCSRCFEALEVRWKKDREEKVAGRILEPAFDEQGRTVCPQCLTQDRLEVVDYGLTKMGLYFFIHECKKCRVKFRYETDKRRG